MLKYILLFFLGVTNVYSKQEPKNNQCCNKLKLNEELISDLQINNLNFDCSNLSPFGKNKCNSHKLCNWKPNCNINFKKCVRYPKYELHYGKMVDVGKCKGLCKINNSCYPKNYGEININENIVKIIKGCECDNCGVVETSKLIEIPQGICKGYCNNQQLDTTCLGGINDSFDTSNIEPSNPSTSLISGILSQCSTGIQSGFDIFTDNRCFGHTFDCIKNKPCKLKSAVLEICMKAANVYLTNTDSLILGTYGNPLWGLGLPTLNGGTWNQGEELCINLDLNNLPQGGTSILNNIFFAGHLDVVVQDDTAVDFVNLQLTYDKCEKCLHVSSVINVLYTSNGITEYKEITDCDCIRESNCALMEHTHTYYPGTLFEQTFNVGQCVGKCYNGVCNAKDTDTKLNKSPEGGKLIKIIKKCGC